MSERATTARVLLRFAAAFAASVAFALAPSSAQETFSGQSSGGDVFNGRSSNPTGTQGVEGNPNCPPPVVTTADGRKVIPKNWSCDSSGYWASRAPHIKALTGPVHPGPDYVPNAANPCQPRGPGSYNWLDNPVGVPLPPGCVRSANKNSGKAVVLRKRDSGYDIIHHKLSPPPVPPPGEPGTYIQKPEGEPGTYVQPEGKPGSYVEPGGEPGSYLQEQPCAGSGTSGQLADPLDPTLGLPLQPAGQMSANYGPVEQAYRKPPLTGGTVATGKPYHIDPPEPDITHLVPDKPTDNSCYRRATLPAGR